MGLKCRQKGNKLHVLHGSEGWIPVTATLIDQLPQGANCYRVEFGSESGTSTLAWLKSEKVQILDPKDICWLYVWPASIPNRVHVAYSHHYIPYLGTKVYMAQSPISDC